MSGEGRSLHRKLAQVMWEAERIPKHGTAPAAMGGYRFVQVGDAADAIRRSLAEKVVSMVPSQVEIVEQSEHDTSRGGVMTTVTVRVTWTLTDGESGETAVIQSLGTGADVGDKYSPKAQTNAMKYALLMGFLLSTGDDPEGASLPERRPLAEPRQEAVSRGGGRAQDDGSLIGTVETGDKASSDFMLRQTPDGSALGFRLRGERGGILVKAVGPIAEQLHARREAIVGRQVTCWGRIADESFTPRGKDRPVTYQVLQLERLSGPDGLALPEDGAPRPPEPGRAEQEELDALAW